RLGELAALLFPGGVVELLRAVLARVVVPVVGLVVGDEGVDGGVELLRGLDGDLLAGRRRGFALGRGGGRLRRRRRAARRDGYENAGDGAEGEDGGSSSHGYFFFPAGGFAAGFPVSLSLSLPLPSSVADLSAVAAGGCQKLPPTRTGGDRSS